MTILPLATPQVAGSGFALRILIVDDNADAADSLAILLNLMGYQTHAAYDGSTALQVARRFIPDVVVLDLTLGQGMDGCEVARRLRGKFSQEVLLVALTGWDLEEDRRRCLDAGFDHFLVKPVNLPELEVCLQNRLSQAT